MISNKSGTCLDMLLQALLARTSQQPVCTLFLATGELAVWHHLRTSPPGTLVLRVLDHHCRQEGPDVTHGDVAGWAVILASPTPPIFAPMADEVTPEVKRSTSILKVKFAPKHDIFTDRSWQQL